MPDYRLMYDKTEFLSALELDGKDVTLTISKVVAAEIVGDQGKKNKKPVLHFEGTERKLVCNKTNGKVIAGLYGKITEAWVGQRVTIFPATTRGVAGDVVDCIRVKNLKPTAKESK